MRTKNIIASAIAASIITGGLSLSAGRAEAANIPYIYEEYEYGRSVNDRELKCIHIENEKQSPNSKKILFNFAIHGFEDAYARDSELLVAIANKIIDYYKENYAKLGTYELYIVPCANPDGLYDGYTNNGYGRCQSNGVDLNRDFDYNFIQRSDARYYTNSMPCSVPESQALRDLTIYIKPDIVVDCHGWLNGYYGSKNLYFTFSKTFPMPYSGGYGSGYYSSWATKIGAEGMLLEFPWPWEDKEKYVETYSNKMIDVINDIASKTLNEQLSLEESEPKIFINGNITEFNRSSINLNGYNNYPIRDICESLGYTVNYDNGNIYVNNGSNEIIFRQDSDIAYVNGISYKLKNKVFTNNSNTFLPIRDLCELLDCSVTWDEHIKAIYIESNNYTRKLEYNFEY